MSEHGEDCYLDPAHHACAIARAARAEGALDEARRVAADALAGMQDAAETEGTLRRIAALQAEYAHDLETKGEEWHPRAKAMVAQIVTQLGTALGPREG